MHSFLSRANAVFAFTLSVLASCTFAAFLTTVLNPYANQADIRIQKALVKNLPDYTANRENHDLGYVHFDIDADVSGLFNWNVKQLFLYLVATYETPNHPENEVVLWDRILLRGDNAVINIKTQHPKYYFWDDGTGLKGNKNVSLRLHWNVVPNAGHLPLVPATNGLTFTFPYEYTTGKI